MVQVATRPEDSFKMEACVLIPEEFSLQIDLSPVSPPHFEIGEHPFRFINRDIPSSYSQILGRLAPTLLRSHMGFSPIDLENCVKVCATKTLSKHARYLPFSGTVRTDKLPFLPYLATLDVRHRLGCYDEMVQRNGSQVRVCNWVRFVKCREQFDERVNIIASRNKGSVLFEVIKEIPEGEELVVFLLPETSSEDTTVSLSALSILRSSIYRRTLDSIISEAPLDLSRSLLASNPSSGGIPEDKSLVANSVPTIGTAIELECPDLDCWPPSKRARFLHPNSQPDPLMVNVFNPASSVFPGYFPLGIQHHSILNSNFSLTRLPSPTSSLSQGKLFLPQKEVIPPKPNSSLRLHLPTSKRRERTMLPCSECGKAFDRPSLLKRHMRTHTGEKPHVCDVCGKGFSTSSSLNTHRRIHSGEKPHQCGVCGKRFTASSNLYYHKMTHVKEKPHKCSLCTRSFPTPGDLRSHMFVHNGQWPHKCAVCGKGFSKLTNLRNHNLLHTGERHRKRSASPASAAEGQQYSVSSSPSSSPLPTSSFTSPSRSVTPQEPSSPPSSPAHHSPLRPSSCLPQLPQSESSKTSIAFHSVSSLAESASSPQEESSFFNHRSRQKSSSTSPRFSESIYSSSLTLPLHLSLSSASVHSPLYRFPVIPSMLPLLAQSHNYPFSLVSTIPSPPLSPIPTTNGSTKRKAEGNDRKNLRSSSSAIALFSKDKDKEKDKDKDNLTSNEIRSSTGGENEHQQKENERNQDKKNDLKKKENECQDKASACQQNKENAVSNVKIIENKNKDNGNEDKIENGKEENEIDETQEEFRQKKKEVESNDDDDL